MQIPKPTILIVDDSATNRRIYSRLSRKLDQEVNVRTFDDPREALAWLAQNSAEGGEVFDRERAAAGLHIGGDAAREVALVEIARALCGQM